jgi:hypothetical protein
MDEEVGIDTFYKEKMSMYIYYYDPVMDHEMKEINIENILEMEEMKKYFGELEELGIFYHPVILQKNDLSFFEKIYYQDKNSTIIFYNAAFPIHDFSFTLKAVDRAFQQLPNNFDILLFKECKDHNRIKTWPEGIENMPTFAVIRKEALFKITYQLWNQIQVYYSNEEISKSFLVKWEDYIMDKIDHVIDWFSDTIYSI